jgi:hypothetical protein
VPRSTSYCKYLFEYMLFSKEIRTQFRVWVRRKKTEASLQRASESLCSVEDAAPLQEPKTVVTEIATGSIG